MSNRQKNNRKVNNRKTTNKVDLKATTCSNCRYQFDKSTERECYKKHWLRDGMEYIDCVPAFVHWKERDLAMYVK